MSSSYAPQPDDPRHQPMLAALHQSFDHHQSDGVVIMEYETELFLASSNSNNAPTIAKFSL